MTATRAAGACVLALFTHASPAQTPREAETLAEPPAASAPAPAPAPARWADGLDITAERARLNRERVAAQAGQARDEADCQKRFAVTDCMNRTRRHWQAVLADLRRQEVALGDTERRQRAAEHQSKLDAKASAQAQEDAARRRAQALADHEARTARAASKASGPAPGGKPRAAAEADGRSGTALTPEEEAANAQAHARRVQQAQERRERLQRRQAERAKPAASALPVPP